MELTTNYNDVSSDFSEILLDNLLSYYFSNILNADKNSSKDVEMKAFEIEKTCQGPLTINIYIHFN